MVKERLRALRRGLRRRLALVRFRTRLWVFRHKLGLALAFNVLLDRRYGGWSGGSRPSSHADIGANLFGSVHYYELPRIFNARNGLQITPADVLVDIGCGKGRVINWWLGRGLRSASSDWRSRRISRPTPASGCGAIRTSRSWRATR